MKSDIIRSIAYLLMQVFSNISHMKKIILGLLRLKFLAMEIIYFISQLFDWLWFNKLYSIWKTETFFCSNGSLKTEQISREIDAGS